MAGPPAVHGSPLAVIDNTLLSRLVDLDLAQFLPLLFKRVLIPPEVKREAFKAPGKRRLRNLINEYAGFFVDCREADPLVRDLLKVDLDEGEAAAIAQADKREATLLLDEERGFKRATTMQLKVIRTGRLLNMLKDAGAIREVRPYHEMLVDKLGFYLSPETRRELLVEAGEETA
ncbi:MAG TPA: hypothetical protein VHE60_09895 [Pyrinomonadaceae bacterium]|nr:hypothetical protein [Pyrinomonadaceae bacterium]